MQFVGDGIGRALPIDGRFRTELVQVECVEVRESREDRRRVPVEEAPLRLVAVVRRNLNAKWNG